MIEYFREKNGDFLAIDTATRSYYFATLGRDCRSPSPPPIGVATVPARTSPAEKDKHDQEQPGAWSATSLFLDYKRTRRGLP